MKRLLIRELLRDGYHIVVKGLYETEEHFEHMDVVTMGNLDLPLNIDKIESYGDGSHFLFLSLPNDSESDYRKIMNLAMFLATPMYVNPIETSKPIKDGNPI